MMTNDSSKACRLFLSLGVGLTLLLVGPGVQAARETDQGHQWFGQVEAYASLLGNLGDRSMEGTSFGGSLKAGYRWASWGLFVAVENNAWIIPSTGPSPTTGPRPSSVKPGALNFGIGGELIYAQRYLRSALTLGPSILLYDDELDAAGTTGLYIDLRPAGIRWPLTTWMTLMVDPISFALVMPVLTGIPLALVEFRSGLTTEFRW